MSNVLNASIEGDLKYVIDFLVDEVEYSEFKARVIEQMLKTVEVPGFRAGKAPSHLALKSLNPLVLQETVIRETLDKFAPLAIEHAKADLTEKNRISLGFNVDLGEEVTKEVEEGFVFRLYSNLLPNVDIDAIKKVSFTEPTEKDLKDRPAFKDFKETEEKRFFVAYNTFEPVKTEAKESYQVTVDMKGEVDGKAEPKLDAENFKFNIGLGEVLVDFEEGVKGVKVGETKTIKVTFPADYFEPTLANKKAEFTLEVKEVAKPKYSSLKALFAESEELTKQYKDQKDFENYLKEFYDKETAKQTQEIRQQRILSAIVKKSPDFSLSQDEIEKEVTRIFDVLLKQSKEQGLSTGTAFIKNGLPSEKLDKLPTMDDLQVKAEVESYVKGEFKLAQILSYVYETQITEKPSEEELNQTFEAVKKNPESYNLPKDIEDDKLKNVVYDRIIRQQSALWLFNQFPVKAEKEVNAKETKAKEAK